MDVHLRELRYFVAVAEELHFTRAARRLYVSQPALSKQIRALEGQLGVALFERDRRAVTLTEAGAALLPLAQEVLETWHDAELAVAERAATAAAILRVGFLTRVGRGLLPAVQAALAATHPAWQLQLRHSDWQDPTGGLADGTSDVAVVWLPLPDAGAFAHHVVATEPRWVAMSAEHPLAAREAVDFAELLDEPFLALPAAAGVARDFWLAVEDRGGRPVRVAAEVASADETFEALLDGARRGPARVRQRRPLRPARHRGAPGHGDRPVPPRGRVARRRRPRDGARVRGRLPAALRRRSDRCRSLVTVPDPERPAGGDATADEPAAAQDGPEAAESRAALLERKLRRSRLLIGALGMLVALSVVAVFATVWYWVSYLLGPGDGAFRRGPYLTRVTTSEAQLRWRVRGGGDVEIVALDPAGAEVRAVSGLLAGLRPDTRYAWTASVDGVGGAGGSFVTPPEALTRPMRFAVLADYGSGDEHEWAVAHALAGQRPEFTVTAGDNSYLSAAGPLLDRNIFRPLGRADAQRPAVRRPRRPRHLPARTGRASASAFDLPDGGRYAFRHGPLQVHRARRAVRPAGPRARRGGRCAEDGPALRFVVVHVPLQPGDPILPVLRDGGVTAVFSGHLHRYERRTVDGVRTFTVGTGGRGPGRPRVHAGVGRRRDQPARHRRAARRRRGRRDGGLHVRGRARRACSTAPSPDARPARARDRAARGRAARRARAARGARLVRRHRAGSRSSAFLVSGGALALDFLDRRWRWLAADVALVALALFLIVRL